MGVHQTLLSSLDCAFEVFCYKIFIKQNKQEMLFVLSLQSHSNFFTGGGFSFAPAWNFSFITYQFTLGIKKSSAQVQSQFREENVQLHFFFLGPLPTLLQVSFYSKENGLCWSPLTFPGDPLELKLNQLRQMLSPPWSTWGAWETLMDVCSTIGRECS